MVTLTCSKCGDQVRLEDPFVDGMCVKCAWANPKPQPSKPPPLPMIARPRDTSNTTAAMVLVPAVLVLGLLATIAMAVSPNENAIFFVAGFLLSIVASGVVGSAIGKSAKGRPNDGAMLGLFLGVIGWVVIFALPDARKVCGQCMANVHPDAKICEKCRSPLT